MGIGQFEIDTARLWESFGISIVAGSFLALFLTPEKWHISIGAMIGGFVLIGMAASSRKTGRDKIEKLQEELHLAKLKYKKMKK